MTGARISSTGVALPERIVHNREIAARLDVDEDWISGRTGIVARRIASDGDDTTSLGALAAARALGTTSPTDVDLIICATITAERRFPATACLIGAALGAQAPAFDLNAGCSGFLFALAQADAAIRSGLARRVVVVGVDVLSRLTDPGDPKTAPLFGDGAGAVIVEASERSDLGPFLLRSDGTRPELLEAGPLGPIEMRGREVYRAAVTGMADSVSALLEDSGMTASDIDLLVAHQANQRILDGVVVRLGIEPDRAFSNIARFGNTSAASIPLVLHDAATEGRLRAGDRVVLTAFGAGFCWGAGLMTWTSVSAGSHQEERAAAHV